MQKTLTRERRLGAAETRHLGSAEGRPAAPALGRETAGGKGKHLGSAEERCLGAAEARLWLATYRENAREIERLTEEIVRWRALAEKTTHMLHLAPGGHSEEDAMQRAVERIEGLERELAATLNRRVRRRRSIEQALDGLPAEGGALLLRLHYVDGLTLAGCAERLDVSLTTVHKRHARALEALRMPQRDRGVTRP